LMVSCLACSSTLKMEAVRSSKTSVNFYRYTNIVILMVIPFRNANPTTV
jgi:hypothetical protein